MDPDSLTWLVIGIVFVAVSVTRVLIAWAPRLRLMDLPNARSSHVQPVPRGGGLAIVIAFMSGLLVAAQLGLIPWRAALELILPGLAVALVGLVDDRRGVRPVIRLAIHLSAATAFVIAIGGASPAGIPWLDDFAPITNLTAILAIAWTVNYFNFMDGIDGIASSQAIFVAGGLALLGWSAGDGAGQIAALLLAAATAGFLFWNWAPARIFMGDVGSGFLGFAVGAMAVRSLSVSEGSMPIVLILSALFLVDATVTLLRRAARGERIHEAHRSHAYQRLARRWSSHAWVTTLYAVLNLVLVAPVAWLAWVAPGLSWIAAGALLLLLSALAVRVGAGEP